MNEEMESDIKEKDNIQFFTDITYYAIPPKPVKYKILILLVFNNKEFKSILCSIALIARENKETLITVYEFLKNKYNWNPNFISIDFAKAEFKALKYVFPSIKIIPCFFHFVANISKKINDLKSKNKNKNKKDLAKDLLSNIKLLVFYHWKKFNGSFKLISDKYEKLFPDFFRYIKLKDFFKINVF